MGKEVRGGQGVLRVLVDYPIRCDLLKHLKTKQNIYLEMCQHGKIKIVHTEFPNIAKNWPNLAPVLRIWRKKYLSGECGGKRKQYPGANPGSDIISTFAHSFFFCRLR